MNTRRFSLFALFVLCLCLAAQAEGLLPGEIASGKQIYTDVNGDSMLKSAVNESRKELWTFVVEGLALIASFIPGVHYASCPLLVVAVAPWIIPDLRMKRVFEEAQKTQMAKGEDEP